MHPELKQKIELVAAGGEFVCERRDRGTLTFDDVSA